MVHRRIGLLVATAAIVAMACTSGGATTAPESQAPASAPPAASEAPGSAPASAAAGGPCTVGVSWNNFQQPRWAAHDQPNIKDTVEAAGGTYIDKDANLSTEQQLTDVDTLLSQGANVLIILAQDPAVIGPAVEKAKAAGVPVIGYDRLIEDPDVLYVTFDNIGVGQAEAEAIMAKVPEGNYVLIKGHQGDPNAKTFLPQGWDNAGLKAAVDAGKITILNGPEGGSGTWPDDYGTYTEDWDTTTAQNNMEAIIDKAVADGKTIDAVLAENDSTALGVAAALTGKAYDPYPPVSGQDGDPANLNNVAKGLQYVDVWKNANELGKAAGAAALALCANPDVAAVTLPDGLLDPAVAPAAGLTAQPFDTPGGNSVSSLVLIPTPLTAENLQLAIDGGQVTKEQLCAGVDAASAPTACQ
jgi:D-xylose transport system substrate-binding protein